MRAASAWRASALEVRLRLRGLGVIDAGVDLIERLPLPDERSFAEQPAEDDAGDLRADVGDLIGGNAARQVLLDRGTALLDDHVADRHGPAWAAATAGPASL